MVPLVMPPWQYEQLTKGDEKPFQPLDKGWIRPQPSPAISKGHMQAAGRLCLVLSCHAKVPL